MALHGGNDYFRKAYIVYRPSEKCIELAKNVRRALISRGIKVDTFWVDDIIRGAREYVDLIVGIGGDGTLLKISRVYPENTPLILPIPCGRRTILYEDIDLDDIDNVIDRVVNGDFVLEDYDRLHILSLHNSYYALNEAALVSIDHGRVVRFEIEMTTPGMRSHLFFYGDGVIVSTSAGSAAYNLSVGGSLLEYSVSGISIAPLNPMELNIKPIIVPRLSKIIIRTHGDTDLYIDGENMETLEKGSHISIEMDFRSFRIIRLSGRRDVAKKVFDRRRLFFVK
ncbi:MAG: NAD(+)/NADH kinase [Crenarchaeota archaeon]|nr:NAD(+)/NADH kinase [Thermoproteota archaeon]